ncbi:hypothetical protein P691DRAFT_806115 [Macrolepiota fuliginosa MF-IS2]|uniref:Uncharacterized protein n=1 Tax=Macrolepiota fuliginosa MF-IS2 TaxID=1400762 RepID=A0A9P6BZA0_9AGAR|nr:hypothetical protein P691DRAFT_806115 [Macrolepiota fuliginosa MF-IS2]
MPFIKLPALGLSSQSDTLSSGCTVSSSCPCKPTDRLRCPAWRTFHTANTNFLRTLTSGPPSKVLICRARIFQQNGYSPRQYRVGTDRDVLAGNPIPTEAYA